MGISTIMSHLDGAKTELCARSFTNLSHQRVSIDELRAHCRNRGWSCIELSDRVLIAKTESARLQALAQVVGHTQQYDPNEVPEAERVPEGAKQSVVVNRYERSASARAACIRRWGLDCAVCGFNFEVAYGERGAGYIHVHHLRPLGEVGTEYQLDPINDLRPVCPNCHAMLHASSPTASIEELKAVLRKCDG